MSAVRYVKLEELIVVSSLTGEGTPENPSREITEFYDKQGNLLATRDEWKDGFNKD